MRPPLVRHSSRIKLFTRNRNRNTFHPLQPIHPSFPLRGKGKSKKKKDRSNFRDPSKRILRAILRGSHGWILRNKLLQKSISNNNSGRKFRFAQSLEKRWFASWFFERGVRNEEKERREGEEDVVLIRSSKTFPLDDRLFSETRRDATRGKRARFLHPWRSWKIEGREKEDTRGC